jgi:hypothetical protein
LGRWALYENLKTFTFKAIDVPWKAEEGKKTAQHAMKYLSYGRKLEGKGCTPGMLVVQMKSVLTKDVKEKYLEYFEGHTGLDKAVKVIHDAFGGEMWVGGALIWKDGV